MSTKQITLKNPAYTYLEATGWITSSTIYVGKATVGNTQSDDFTARLSFTIDEELASAINSLKKLSLTLKTTQNSNPGYTVAFLTNTSLAYNKAFRTNLSASSNGYIAKGNNSLEAGNKPSGTEVTYVFEGITLTAGTYYIYIVRKGTSQSGFCAYNASESALSNSISVDYLTTYTVTYNIGTGTSGLPSHQEKIEDTDLKLSSNTPSMNNTSEYSNFTITGNANGGYPDDEITATKTSIYTHPFSHWLGSDGKTYGAGDTYTGNADITLTAQYDKRHDSDNYSGNTLGLLSKPSRDYDIDASYTVTFDPNGGSCNTDNLQARDLTLYEFNCWNSNKEGNGSNYTDETSLTSESIVYAKWNEIDSKEKIILPTAERNGYDFQGWAVSISSDSVLDPGSNYMPDKNITLYAIWKAKGLVHIKDIEALAWVYCEKEKKWKQIAPTIYKKSDGQFHICE